MKRDLSHEEARDERVYELTAEHYHKLRAKLQGGNADLAQAIDDEISHQLGAAFWLQLITDAAHPTRDALIGGRFRILVEKVLLAQAENEALREVEQLEQQFKKSNDEARIGRAALDRAH